MAGNHNHSLLRAAVFQAMSQLPPARQFDNAGLEESNGHFLPGHGLQQADCLASLVFTAALKLMQEAGTLHKLFAGGSSAATRNGGVLPLNAANLFTLSKELYAQFKEFCPADLLSELPGPQEIDKGFWSIAGSRLADPRLSSHWQDESSLGFLYQYFSMPLRKKTQKLLQSPGKTLSLQSLIAFTQIYTPHWVIDFLLQNTVLSQWAQPADQDKYPFFLAGKNGTSRLPAAQLKLIDPACGSGNFLIRAFDLFLHMHLLEGCSESEALSNIFLHNLSGVDIDPAALWIAALALMLKSRRVPSFVSGIKPKLACVQTMPVQSKLDARESLLGSLCPVWRQDVNHLLGATYHVVATNPPYIGRKLLDRRLKALLKKNYPESHQDFCAAFLRLGLDLLCPGGRLGLIGQSAMMFLPTYGKLRKHLIEKTRLVSIVEAGSGVFPLQGGQKVSSALYVVESCAGEDKACQAAGLGEQVQFFDIAGSRDKDKRLRELLAGRQCSSAGIYLKSQTSLAGLNRCAFNYKCPALAEQLMRSLTKLGAIAQLKQGLATTDNQRFVRFRWQVDAAQLGIRWFPYVKGAGQERWWAPVDHVVDWYDNGADIKQAVAGAYPYLQGKVNWVVKNEQFYFKEGLTFSFVNSRGLAVRRLAAGCIFDVGGSAIFANPSELDFLLGYLNSSFIQAMAGLLNPTINFQVGDLKELPVLPFTGKQKDLIAGAAERCCRLKQLLLEHGLPSTKEDIVPFASDIAGGASFNDLWQDYSGKVSAAVSALTAAENDIDATVKACLTGQWGSNEQGLEELLAWTHEHARTGSLPAAPSAADFARLIVLNLLHMKWHAPHTVSLLDNEELRSFLGIDKRDGDWLEDCLGMTLPVYFAGQFNNDMSVRYRGSPYYSSLAQGTESLGINKV